MWFTRDQQGLRGWFVAQDSTGVLRPGLIEADTTITIISPNDSTNVTATINESSQKPGLYFFDVASSFFTTNGTGVYSVVVEVDTSVISGSGSPEIKAVLSSPTRVSNEDVDSLQASIDLVATDVTFIKDVEGGRWKIDSGLSQMIFYKDDGTTEVARFNLLDSSGASTATNPFERVRV